MTPADASSTQDQVLQSMGQGQQAVVDAVKSWAKAIEGLVPDSSRLQAPSGTPSAGELVDQAFDFAEKLLAAQRDFARKLLSAAAAASDEAGKAASTST
jgi:hypothetical protein